MLPEGFIFTQSALTRYDRCRRRFLLEQVHRMDWPAPVTDKTEEWEGRSLVGREFHRLVEQDAHGIEPDPSVFEPFEPELRTWWENYLTHAREQFVAESAHSEIDLFCALGEHRVQAKFDRILVDSGGLCVVDWKTGSRPLNADRLSGSWQTQVYLFVATEAGSLLLDGVTPEPEDVRLMYWHAAFPDSPVEIRYSRAVHDETRASLLAHLDAIARLEGESSFPKTTDEKECTVCPYQTYCHASPVLADLPDRDPDEASREELLDELSSLPDW